MMKVSSFQETKKCTISAKIVCKQDCAFAVKNIDFVVKLNIYILLTHIIPNIPPCNYPSSLFSAIHFILKCIRYQTLTNDLWCLQLFSESVLRKM